MDSGLPFGFFERPNKLNLSVLNAFARKNDIFRPFLVFYIVEKKFLLKYGLFHLLIYIFYLA